MLLRAKVGMSGPFYTLDPGDEWHFDEEEAGRLIAAGHAELVESSVTTEVKSSRRKRKADVVPSQGNSSAGE